jgi:U3 small nucleolar RNA-associated protein 23
MPLHRYLENTLHGKVKPFVTKCTLASILQTTDLHTSKRPDFLPPPTDLPLRHCSHAEVGEGEVLPEEDCLLDLLSGGVTGNQQPKNKQHFVLATADPLPVKNDPSGRSGKVRRPMSASAGQEIRAYAREIPGVPIIYVRRSVMILEELSGTSLGVRRREEKDKFREGLIEMGSRKRKRDEEAEDEGRNKEDGDAGEADAIQPKKKKTKKVKGPNPLSVLKKKPKPKIQPPRGHTEESASTALPETNGVAIPDTQPKAKRKRKHGKQRVVDSGGAKGQHDTSELMDGISEADKG